MSEILSPMQIEKLREAAPILDDIWIYDTEVFLNDWLLVFIKPTTGKKKVFHNDNYGVAGFLDTEKPVLGGYNVKNYDQWILKAIYHGADNATVKALNDFIIAEGHSDAWTFPYISDKKESCPQFDLMDDISPPLRLKQIEGNLGMDIEESSVPFNLDRPLTDDELEKTIKYCSHDVETTVRLFYERRDYLASKITVGAMKNLSVTQSMWMTNAKLTAAYLGARFCDRQDEFEYDFPANLLIDTYLKVIEFFSRVDPKYKATLEIDIAGVPHTIAWGGLHGALEHYSEEKSAARKIMHIDVTSYYPSLMIQNQYMSRSVPDPDEYRRVYKKRIAAKKAGDKSTAEALKLILNTTFGVMKSKYNALYDPRMGNSVCISGQLYLIDLIEKLETVPTFKLIQSNTDGLIVSYDAKYQDNINLKVHGWEVRTGFHMGFDEIEKIVQKDVNNYCLRGIDGSIEVKGGYVSNYNGGNFKNKSLVIVAKAIVAKLLDGIPVEETIGGCNDIGQFQIITKAGGTYDKVVWENAGKDVDVQNVNRVYACKDTDCGTLYKIKFAKSGQKEARDKTANLPAHCLIDNKNICKITAVEKQFYIDFARKRVNDYLGIKPDKPKKERKKSMPTRKTADAPITLSEPVKAGLGAKLMILRAAMDGFKWEKDGVNRHQSYSYITEKQYKNNFKKALAVSGLDFIASMLEYQFIPNVTDKMNMIIAKFSFEIIDRESGEREVYPAFGSGADMGDKGLYKAYTGAIKYFIANNFLVAEENDPESDVEEVRQEKPVYAPPAKREEIRDKISDQNAPATDVQMETIANGIAAMEDAGISEDIILPFTEMLAESLSKEIAEQVIDEIHNLLDGAA